MVLLAQQLQLISQMLTLNNYNGCLIPASVDSNTGSFHVPILWVWHLCQLGKILWPSKATSDLEMLLTIESWHLELTSSTFFLYFSWSVDSSTFSTTISSSLVESSCRLCLLRSPLNARSPFSSWNRCSYDFSCGNGNKLSPFSISSSTSSSPHLLAEAPNTSRLMQSSWGCTALTYAN